MIDTTAEVPISLTDATKALPPIDGKRPHPSTVFRWCKRGLRGVNLEYVRIGNRICTTCEARSRFANNLADADARQDAAPRRPRTRTSRQREDAVERAEKVLRAGGIL